MATMARIRVERGAVLLDQQRPGWDRQIDRDTLLIESAQQCVLGQLYGSYEAGCTKVFGHALAPAAECGFTVDMFTPAWRELNEEWQQFLKERERERALLPV